MGRGESEADLLFRADAERLGYLSPGGAGLWAYYRDHGMIAPEDERYRQKRETKLPDDAL